MLSLGARVAKTVLEPSAPPLRLSPSVVSIETTGCSSADVTANAVILVVDDDADTLDLLRCLLVHEGFEVRTASDGAEAIESLRSHRPDAVVTDLMMPGITGHEVVEFVRTSGALAGLPIAVVSGHPELAPAGCEVFAKPLVFKRLLDFLSKHTAPTG